MAWGFYGGERGGSKVTVKWAGQLGKSIRGREANEGGQNVVRSCKGYRNWAECVRLLTRM